MIVHKCDRCGVYIDFGAKDMYGSILNGNLRPGQMPNQVHLCPDCASNLGAILRDWWNKPARDKIEQEAKSG